MQHWTYDTQDETGKSIPYQDRQPDAVRVLNESDLAKVLDPFLSRVNLPGIANKLHCNPETVENLLRASLRGVLAEQVIELTHRNEDLLQQILEAWRVIGGFEVQFPPSVKPPAEVVNGAEVVRTTGPGRTIAEAIAPLLVELATRRKGGIS
jgi:hypothetical protein